VNWVSISRYCLDKKVIGCSREKYRLIPGFLRKIIDFLSNLWYAMTLIRGRTLLIEPPLGKNNFK
jgi:hypothetical protein